MKKEDLVKLLLNHSNIGELVESDLKKMSLKSLEALQVELDEEANQPVVEAPKKGKSKAKTEAPVKTEAPKVEPFLSMCGLSYDPAVKSSCNIQCKKDYPDDQARCVAHFKLAPAKVSKEKKAVSAMNKWYHRTGTQGELLDRFFTDGNIGTVNDIAKFANCNTHRVMIHIAHLVADFGVEILKGQKKGEDGKANTVFFLQEKHKARKGEVVPGKTAFPNGYPKDHPCSKK